MGKHKMRLPLTLRSTSTRQTAKTRSEKGEKQGREGERKEKKNLIQITMGAVTDNFPRQLTRKPVR